MNVEEAWAGVTDTMILEDKRGWSQVEIESAVRAYGAARELKGHVDACGRVCSELDRLDALCGDGWLCEDAREIEELGK